MQSQNQTHILSRKSSKEFSPSSTGSTHHNWLILNQSRPKFKVDCNLTFNLESAPSLTFNLESAPSLTFNLESAPSLTFNLESAPSLTFNLESAPSDQMILLSCNKLPFSWNPGFSPDFFMNLFFYVLFNR